MQFKHAYSTLVCWFGFSLMEKKNEIYEQQKANNFAEYVFFRGAMHSRSHTNKSYERVSMTLS